MLNPRKRGDQSGAEAGGPEGIGQQKLSPAELKLKWRQSFLQLLLLYAYAVTSVWTSEYTGSRVASLESPCLMLALSYDVFLSPV